MRRVLAVTAALALLAACSDDAAVVHDYDRSPVPAVPDRTAEVVATDPLPDGQYWAPDVVVADDGFRLVFTLQQALFGPTCEAELGLDACDGGVGVIADPSRDITVAAEGRSPISVAAPNAQNYAVGDVELVNLIAGGSPSADAPAGFAYTPYPYLLTVRNGEVTAIQQIWMP